MEAQDRPRQSSEHAVREIDGLMFLMDPDTSELHGLNDVGSTVWGLLDGQRTVADIAAAVESEYEVGLETATSDVLEFLADMEKKGLVHA